MSMTNERQAYENPIVRSAEITDSDEAAELIFLTGERLFKYLFFPERERTVAVIKQLFEMEENDFSHQYAYTAILGRKIAGIIVFVDRVALKNTYRKMGWKILKVIGFWPFVCRLPRFVRVKRLIPKIADNTLYISHISVFNAFRGRRIAAHLLRFCEKQARARGLTRLALDVEVGNYTATGVYEQFGFRKKRKIECKLLNLKFGFKGLHRMDKEL